MTIAVLIAGYLGFVRFVLALLTVAKRSDEAQGAVRHAAFGADDAEFLEGPDRRAARWFESPQSRARPDDR